MQEPPSRSASGQPPSFQVRIPVEWAEDNSVPIVYANQVLISHGGPEFFMVFGVLLPPANPAELPDVVKIKPLVRIVVARDAMPAFVHAMSENLRRYQDALARAAAGQDLSTGSPSEGESSS